SRFVTGTDNGDEALAVCADARRWGISPRHDTVRQMLERELARAVSGIADGGPQRANAVLDLAQALELTLNTWAAQNEYYAVIATDRDRRWPRILLGDLRRLGERLSFHLREWEALAARAA